MSILQVYQPIFESMNAFVNELNSQSEIDIQASLDDFCQILSTIEKKLEKYEYSSDFIYSSQFAVAALFDEKVLSSEYENLSVWQGNPLQKRLFATTNAGVEFFAFLDDVNKHDNESQELRQIYFYCLKLGFCGKYYELGIKSKLKAIIDANYQLLKKDILLPEMKFSEQPRTKSDFHSLKYSESFNHFLTWIPLVLVLLVYIYLRNDLAVFIDNFVAQLIEM